MTSLREDSDAVILTTSGVLRHEYFKVALNGLLASGCYPREKVVEEAWRLAEQALRFHKFVEEEATHA